MTSAVARTRIKFCGLTRVDDVHRAVALGVDALGFVMWPGSQRAIDLSTLAALAAEVPAFVTRVGLFVDADPAFVRRCAPYLDLLQFHGNESPDDCARHSDRAWIKALRMRDDVDLEREAARYSGARALLLDAYRPGVPGGTGDTFDWSRIPAALAKPVILAGGLTPDNIGPAVHQVAPHAVDVSGGVEAAPGIKDPTRMAAFVREVSRANQPC